MVNLAGLFALLVNGTDLHRQHKAHFAPTALGQFALHRVAPRRPEPVEPVFGRLEFRRQFCEPLGVGVIAGADDIDALERRPLVQIGTVEVGVPGQILSRPCSIIEHPSMLPTEVPGKATALRRRAIARPRPALLGPLPDPL